MIKKLLPYILTLLLFFLIPSAIHAADIDITCYPDQKPLVVKNTNPLFTISGFAPGDINSKSIKIVNTDSTNPCRVSIYPSGSTNSLGNKIIAQIGSTFNDTLNTFINEDIIDVANVAPSSTVEIPFSLTFLSDSGNVHSNQNISFDFNLGFVYGSALDGIDNGNVNGAQDTNRPDTMASETDIAETLSENENKNEEVLGQETNNDCRVGFPYWILVLIVQLILTLPLLFLWSRSSMKNFGIVIISVILGLIAYLVINKIGCTCNPVWLCIHHIWANLVIALLPVLGLLKRRTKKEELYSNSLS